MNVLRPNSPPRLILPPENAALLRRHARGALEAVGTYGTLPTPLDQILETRRLGLVPDLVDDRASFLAGLSGRTRAAADSVLVKLRGVLDLRARKVWVREEPGKPRWSRFPQAHEIAHDLLPWHTVRSEFLDDNETLSPEVRVQMEREANYAAAQLLFQGELFERRVRDLKESIHSALVLADEHETTFHSTLWAYVEAQDRPIAVAVYRKTDILGDDGFPIYRQSEVYAAGPFADRYSGIELPHRIGGRHPWIEGLRAGEDIPSGSCQLRCDGSSHAFAWEAWTNSYSVFVFIRREPRLAPFGRLVRRTDRHAA